MLSSDTQTFPKYTKREKRKLKKLAATSPSLAFWVTTHEGLIEEEAEKKELPENFALNTLKVLPFLDFMGQRRGQQRGRQSGHARVTWRQS